MKNTDDVWERKRGSDDQIAQLFVAMARAAGLKAYLMAVTNRDRSLFLPDYLSLRSWTTTSRLSTSTARSSSSTRASAIAPTASLRGSTPSCRACARRTEAARWPIRPAQSYKDSRTDRVADLTMDEHGEAAGTVTMIYRGAPALGWRQRLPARR